MSDKIPDLSRRKVLGSVATLGGAAVIGGAGSTAFFSDEEEFANNRLVAGSLDLKVDWQEHYSDWSDDEAEGIDTVQMEPGDGLAGFPSAAPESQQSVFVSDPDQFLRNTAIEAFPDVLEDPADSDATYDALKERPEDDSDICDLPADLDGALSHPFRTRGTFPSTDGEVNPQTTEPGDPLVKISDVKPGDFGEVTFSFHLCGNPGYVWLTAALQSAAENGLTEPESKDPDEDGDPDSTVPADVELLDAVRAAFWYDTGPDGAYGADFADKDEGEGDNYAQDEESVVQMGTLGSVLAQLQNNPFPLDAEPITEDDGDDGDDDNGNDNGGGQTIGDISEASYTQYTSTEDEPFKSYVTNASGNAVPRNLNCADYETLLGIDLVGTAIEAEALEAGMSYTSCAGLTVDDVDQSSGTITLSTANPVRVVSVKGGNEGEEIYVFDEAVVLDGVTFSTPTGQMISNIDVCCPVDGDDDNGNGGGFPGGGPEDRQCFPNSTTAYVGFEWWLPVDHANEIQTDSASFDLGFYTEQCRHNDGSLGNREL